MARAWFLIMFAVCVGYTHGQNDTIKCFGITQQKQILKKFVELDECRALRVEDSAQIAKLDTALVRSYEINIKYLHKINEQHYTIDVLDKKVRNRNKTIGGLAVGNIIVILLLLL